jgi:hypothetical protein
MKIERKLMSQPAKKIIKKPTKKAAKAKVKKSEPTKKIKKVVKKIVSKKEVKKQVVKKPVSKKLTPKKVVSKKEKKPKKEENIKIKDLKLSKEFEGGSVIDEMTDETVKVEDKADSETVVDVAILELEKKKKTYWSDDTEVAVVDFLNNDCNFFHMQLEKYFENCKKNKEEVNMDHVNSLQEKFEWANTSSVMAKKERIYKDHIHKPLNRLVENIIFNFKLFRPGIDIKTLQADCLSFVYSKFANFNPGQNTKSFSFFGTIAKHYLMGEKKETDKSHQVNLDYDDHKEEADGKDTMEIGKKSDLDNSYSLFTHVVDSIEKEIQKKLNNPEEKKSLSDNDLKVADAIVHIFKTHELLGAYNKNHVYHLIKEHTGLQTKDITYSLARFRVFYRLLKQDFIRQNVDKD